MALTKKVRAAGSSRFSDSMKSTVVPSLSTALSHPYAIRHHSVVCNAFERLQKNPTNRPAHENFCDKTEFIHY